MTGRQSRNDPSILAERRIRPDGLAYRGRGVTRRMTADLHDGAGLAGFRPWSARFGEWYTVVLFSDRLPESALTFGEGRPLEPDHPAVISAAATLAVELHGTDG